MNKLFQEYIKYKLKQYDETELLCHSLDYSSHNSDAKSRCNI